MDASIGDLSTGDILVEDGVIAEVGSAKTFAGAEIIDGSGMIAMPGLVDTHSHMWTSLLRGMFRGVAAQGYFPMRNAFSGLYEPEDMYRAEYGAAVEAIASGITTTWDFCHNVRTPAYANACMEALAESGIRARFSYGPYPGLDAGTAIDLADLQRLSADWAGAPLLEVGLAWRGPLGATDGAAYRAAREEYEAARALGLSIAVHVSGPRAATQFASLKAGGFYADNMQLIHATGAGDEEFAAMRDNGVAVSLTPLTELRCGYGVTQLGDYTGRDVAVGIGLDGNALSGNADLFAVMKIFLNIENGRFGDEFRTNARELLELATIGGARSMGLDHLIGSITPGKRADLILIDTNMLNLAVSADDPAHLIVESVQPANVDTVFVDGRPLKRGGALIGVDTRQAVAEFRAASDGLKRRYAN